MHKFHLQRKGTRAVFVQRGCFSLISDTKPCKALLGYFVYLGAKWHGPSQRKPNCIIPSNNDIHGSKKNTKGTTHTQDKKHEPLGVTS